MPQNILIEFAKDHYRYGLIGLDEYIERVTIARWLYNDHATYGDPRGESGEDQEEKDDFPPDDATVTGAPANPDEPDDEDYLCFLFQGWIFTKADPDPYPSTPHGHWQNQNRPWPKLNPYTGRVFADKHNENKSMRLTKREMRVLWNDQKFRGFCRDYLKWYLATFPYHDFGVSYIFRLPHW
ncbi:hypothetical protein [Neokomagataea anthophila]|uniref:Uncharacterized protein n=1 Tax=Neokomagataea anthophila TaxID=2826925 RepID=A0ABS5E9C3_9PROT|nr:hypothetical protein [Neokomagataea anthophila]MBR0560508.1 hypothetical protein [Neokomagataea anthophila]